MLKSNDIGGMYQQVRGGKKFTQISGRDVIGSRQLIEYFKVGCIHIASGKYGKNLKRLNFDLVCLLLSKHK